MSGDVLSGARRWCVEHCRAEDLESRLPDGCVDLILTDPPFHKVKDETWDREHATAAGFLQWIGERLRAWRRILAPNGSLYVFASPEMGARVECAAREHFEVLCNIRWAKDAGWHQKAREEDLRGFFPASESIIFAEQKGSDSIALGESQYAAKCDELRGFVFEPIRAYLDRERERARLTRKDIDGAWQRWKENNGGMSGHWFSRSQWALPTNENYEWLRGVFNRGEFVGLLERSYEALREQYEALREQYEALRRPFAVSADVPHTDVWTYPTVATYPGKHPCEKPARMAEDIVCASSREDGVVADFFSGSGVFAAAAVKLGRRAIACDMDPHWVGVTEERCAHVEAHGIVPRVKRPRPEPPQSDHRPAPPSPQLDLFAAREAA